jgi:hypothetical protein
MTSDTSLRRGAKARAGAALVLACALVWTCGAGAQTAPATATSPADASTVAVRPVWKAGEELRYRITRRRETLRSGQPPAVASVQSELKIRVAEAGATGYRLGWRSSLDLDRPLSADTQATLDTLAQRMPETLRLLREGQEVDIVTDEDGLPVRLAHPEALEQTARVLRTELDALLKTPGKEGAANAVPEAVVALVRRLASPELIGRQQLAFAQSLLAVMGGEFEGQTPIDVSLMLDNPIGQMLGTEAPALKAQQRWQLQSATATELVVGHRIDTDPDTTRLSLARALEQLGEKVGKPVPKDAVRRAAIQDNARYTIDRSTGWPERVLLERRIEMEASNGQGTRTETHDIVRIR